jgi:cycloartenol synthase
VITLSITGALHAVLSDEHKKEIIRYLYNHQACDCFFLKQISFIRI